MTLPESSSRKNTSSLANKASSSYAGIKSSTTLLHFLSLISIEEIFYHKRIIRISFVTYFLSLSIEEQIVEGAVLTALLQIF